MINLSQRSDEEELMDDLLCAGAVVDQTLAELDVINRLLGGNQISLKVFKDLIEGRTQPLHLVDLGCGSGGLMKVMAELCRKKGIEATFTGIDANPNIVAYAKNHTRDYPEISYRCLNVLSKEFQEIRCDVIHACLFCHHFTSEQLALLFTVFRQMAKEQVIINDLHRHHLAYYSIKWLTGWFSKSEMVKNDAATSVARGFKKEELKEILSLAAIETHQLSRAWAFRWKLIY